MAAKWSKEKVKILEDLLASGWGIKQIANHPKFQCSPANISQQIKKHGLTASRFQKIEDLKKAEDARATIVREGITEVLMKKLKNGEMEKESPHYLGMLYKNLGDDRRKEKGLEIKNEDMGIIAKMIKDRTEKSRKKFIKNADRIVDVDHKEVEDKDADI